VRSGGCRANRSPPSREFGDPSVNALLADAMMALAEDVASLVSTHLHAVQSAAVAEAIVADVYRDFEREAEDHPGAGAGAGNLTYGELTLPTLRRLLEHPAVAECIEGANSRGGGGRKSDGGGGTGGTGGTFVDVGSGSGRVSVAAALLVEVDTVLGVEVDEDWHAVASAARERLLAHADAGFIRARELMFVCADAVAAAAETWVEAADVAYICCTCFGPPLLAALAEVVERLREGAVVITISHKLPAREGVLEDVCEPITGTCTWGHATIHMQRRTDLQLDR